MTKKKNDSSSNLVKQIAGRLTGINKEDLTTAEKQIARILIENNILKYDEHDDLVLCD